MPAASPTTPRDNAHASGVTQERRSKQDAGPSAKAETDLPGLLAAAKAELQHSLGRKRAIDRNLATIEHSIYQFESSYLSTPLDGTPAGNVVRGYDSYLKALTATNLGPYDRKRTRLGPDVREEDRLFSRSSETYLRSLELKEKDLSATSGEDEPAYKKRKR